MHPDGDVLALPLSEKKNTMKETTSFVFYPEWAEALSVCSREVRSLVYEAVIEYGTTGSEPAIAARWATTARSCVSCTELEASMVKPVVRQLITS